MHRRKLLHSTTAFSLVLLTAAYAGAVTPGDLNGDGCVNQVDLGILLADYSCTAGVCNCVGDVNGDGKTDQSDLGDLLANYFDTNCEQIAGRSLTQYPFFEWVSAFNAGETVRAGISPSLMPSLIGKTVDIYVTADKSFSQWKADPNLADVVTGLPLTVAIGAGTIQAHTYILDAGTLPSSLGTLDFGRPYDVVIDVNQDGKLGPGDFIDGMSDAGFGVVHDIVANGPLATSSITYGTASTASQQVTYYPSNIALLGQLPLVAISHGNGHNYLWYGFLQSHLASYGYIAMSHFNLTGGSCPPCIDNAADTTQGATEYILANQATIGGGVLNGHIDKSRIMWIGHSRGGESVARAYDRLFDAFPGMPPGVTQFNKNNIRVVSSIAPTDFMGPNVSDPHDVNYHLLYGAADGDVSGVPSSDIADSFNLLDRATHNRASTYLHGADHNDFNCCGFEDYAGPVALKIGRLEAQRIQKATTLALLKYYQDGNQFAADYLHRQYEAFKPIGTSYISPDPGFTTAPVVVDRQFKQSLLPGCKQKLIIDDYQEVPSSTTTSSPNGYSVVATVSGLAEGILNDTDGSFTWPGDTFNGFTWARTTDTTKGAVFNYTSPSSIEWNLPPTNFHGWQHLSLRACQRTRHTQTIAALGDLTFTVTLRDTNNVTSSINIGAFGGGIEEPFQRDGAGTGTGWQNEAETIRIRLKSFQVNGTGLDLSKINQVRLSFGTGFGDAVGALGLDDLELVT
jgi:hypothetical protein